ncbi:MAG: hypothetical protein R2932_47865 [Caldilineaceae bacterium]
MTDALHSVRGLVDGAGAGWLAEYAAFGALRNQTGMTSSMGFTGELFSTPTGLLHLRKRVTCCRTWAASSAWIPSSPVRQERWATICTRTRRIILRLGLIRVDMLPAVCCCPPLVDYVVLVA